ncbi:diaminopimelate epimerase [Actinomyces sp. MRS3W]|uniref:diaminopimelate epimerase n=1 Tax=Actinomyces sp. MRS3W TaxID=2800796 RepID=UPI0028FD0BC9|nr:diaminopimelate epimerase [Actinomyces sp. MRS3W]MDU0347478.1 diaminopimelate epimerase [Actinomyces sp. MRS3W]
MTIAPGLAGHELLKGHAAHSDFLLLLDPECEIDMTAADIAAVCDRYAGLGAAGLIRVVRTAALPGTEAFREAAPEAEWFLDCYRSDGSVARAYGDALRLFAAVLDAEGLAPLADGESITVGTRGGARTVTRLGQLWAVDMGRVRLAEVAEPDADPIDEGWDTAMHIPGLEGDRAALSLELVGRHAVVALLEEAELDAAALGDAGETGGPAVATPETEQVELVVPLGEHIDPETGNRVGLARIRMLEGDAAARAEACCAVAVALHEWSGAEAPADYLLRLDDGELGVHVDAAPAGLREAGAEVLVTGPAVVIARATVA